MDKTTQNSLFETIITEHKGIFFKVAKTYCKDEDDRKDLLQEMMIQVWASLPSYNKEFKLTTWLYRVVLNVAISFYRKYVNIQNHHQVIDFTVQDFTDTSESMDNPNLVLLEKFISDLNDLDKALIILYLEDRSHAEISEIVGISISNVSTKVLRIKEKIKQKINQNNGR
jgi:RNA polymerase sigma factor (sigma-70 family)